MTSKKSSRINTISMPMIIQETLLIVMMMLSLLVSVHAKEFRVYWNIPTFHCKQYKFPVVDVQAAYGILQNDGDTFRGNQVSILYDPGLFPALLSNATSGQIVRRNGGVPQAGSLRDHLDGFAKNIEELIPDKNNNGLAIIDFESWRPVYRQNFGTLEPYKTVSIELARQKHCLWPKARIEAEAQRDFEASGRSFMLDTLQLAKQLRPNARWGYYGLPFCFNGKGDNIQTCGKNIQIENDSTQWLYDASQVIFPSVYMSTQILPQNRVKMVRGRVQEAQRLRRFGNEQMVIAYHRYVLSDSREYLSESDTWAAFNAMRQMGADGVILWGASNDLNSKAKCEQFYNYLETVLGPVARSFGVNYDVYEAVQENKAKK